MSTRGRGFLQGSSVNVHQGGRRSDDTGYSKQEKEILRRKNQGNPYMLERINSQYADQFDSVRRKRNAQKSVQPTKKSVIKDSPWESVQDKTNNLALELLRSSNKKTDV